MRLRRMRSFWLLGAVFTFTIGGVVVQPQSALACSPGFCTEACLSGNYAFSLTGEKEQSGATVHRGFNGILNFNPSSEEVTGRAILTADHAIFSCSTPPTEICSETVYFCENGSYTIDADCTGTLSLDLRDNCSNSSLGGPTWYFALEDGGTAFRFMAINGDMVGVGNARRQ
jgi:hypothetical protein